MTVHETEPIPGWLSLEEVAQDIGCTRQNVHKLIAAGKLKGVRRLGVHKALPREEVDRYITEQNQ